MSDSPPASVPASPTLSPARLTVLTWVHARAGSGVAVSGRCGEYEEACYPLDTEATRRYEGPRRSACGLFGETSLRVGGVKHALLSIPFANRVGMAVADIQTIAHQADAWCQFGAGQGTPMPGDLMLIDDDPIGKVDRAHIIVVTEYVPQVGGEYGDTARMDSVDGGQILLGGNAITDRRRYLKLSPGGKVWTYADEACTQIDRRVYGWLDLDATLAKFGN